MNPSRSARRDPQQLVPPERPGRGDRVRQVAVPVHRLPQRLRDLVGVPAGELVGVAEQPQHLGRAHEQVRHQLRRAEQLREPLDDRALVAQHPQVPGGGGERLGHPPVREQPAVRVGGVGEQVEQRRQQRALDRGARATPRR